MKGNVYTVRKGDTLYSISEQFGTDVRSLAEYNGIPDPDIIAEGMLLRIPETEGERFFYYTIRPGDTLYSIAKRFDTDTQVLARLNGIPVPDEIKAGDTIRIPAYPMGSRVDMIIVKKEDTLYSLGKKYGKTAQELAQMNNIPDPDVIYPGQLLIVRRPEKPGRYQVQKGDTLWKISESTGVPVVKLINLNRLACPDKLSPGMWLLLE